MDFLKYVHLSVELSLKKTPFPVGQKTVGEYFWFLGLNIVNGSVINGR